MAARRVHRAQGQDPRPTGAAKSAAREVRRPAGVLLLKGDEDGDGDVVDDKVLHLRRRHLNLPEHEPHRHDEGVDDVAGVEVVEGLLKESRRTTLSKTLGRTPP